MERKRRKKKERGEEGCVPGSRMPRAGTNSEYSEQWGIGVSSVRFGFFRNSELLEYLHYSGKGQTFTHSANIAAPLFFVRTCANNKGKKKKQSERDRAAIDVWGTVSTTTSSNSSTSKFPLEGRAETTGNAIVPPLRSRSGPHYQGVGGRRRGRGHGDEEEAAGKKKQARTQHVYSRIEEEYERARK